jgi:hypothetical protein
VKLRRAISIQTIGYGRKHGRDPHIFGGETLEKKIKEENARRAGEAEEILVFRRDRTLLGPNKSP